MKPCPFCGYEKPRVVKLRATNKSMIVGIQVVCEPDYKPCGADGPIRDSERAAKRAWNKRIENQQGRE